MSRDFSALLTAHERQEASGADLRRKLRTLRQELEARDKSLELARRTVDRLNAEKGKLEAGAAGEGRWLLHGSVQRGSAAAPIAVPLAAPPRTAT